MSENNTDIEKQLFELKYCIANKLNIIVYSWIYYNKNNDLCILSNDKGNIIIKDKIIKVDTYFIKLVDKRLSETININEIKNEIEFINISHKLYNQSNNIVKYISNIIDNNYGLNMFETFWLIKNNNKKYLKITIDMYRFIIKLTNYDEVDVKEIFVSPKQLKIFLNLNKSKILQVIKNNNKLYKVKMEKNKRLDYEKHLQEKKQKEQTFLIPHDTTRKVGSGTKSSSLFIHKSLKERYEIHAQKPFPTKYSWDADAELNI